MTVLREGVAQALGFVAAGLLLVGVLDLATCWMALAYLPSTSLVYLAVLGWLARCALAGVGAWGLLRRHWAGPLAALVVLGGMVFMQQSDWFTVAGRSPYRARLAWPAIWIVVLAVGLLPWRKDSRDV